MAATLAGSCKMTMWQVAVLWFNPEPITEILAPKYRPKQQKPSCLTTGDTPT